MASQRRRIAPAVLYLAENLAALAWRSATLDLSARAGVAGDTPLLPEDVKRAI
jgi:hypothetical protein